ncbi:hypothetical protein B0T14DRAFT_567558 [Immersiella caudata]|uniref:Nephrocystin 3-like N-terminal domain-containing protein n=1 Tax=Immersiella caudata TaxID=314043 RepID=A0AA40C0V6_9PEZI|nr:hypothetical protein B0T14DRAFT_567558 [Immersiella caudata]
MSPEPGLQLFFRPEKEDAVVDLVFVHGLGGGHLSTWSKGDTCWPRDLLKDDIPLATIYSYEYDSKIIKLAESTSRTSLGGHAQSLLNEIARARRDAAKHRPIIFVCHSLGGFGGQAKYYHNKEPHHAMLGSILKETLGVIFLGTPHRGSIKASIGRLTANAGKVLGASDKLLRALECDSDLLEQQRQSFDLIRRSLYIVCLREDLPMTGLGMIVPEISVFIDGSDVLKEAIPGSDHRTMAKFAARSEKGYTIVVDYIRSCLGMNNSAGVLEGLGRGADESAGEKEKLILETNLAVMNITNQCILLSLFSPDIDQRHATITPAHRSVVNSHKSTFDWIFAKPGPSFRDWLECESGGGLFWISGKAGSGKSTLAKFIANDPRLHRFLNRGDEGRVRPFLHAKFFFWAAGTATQRTQEGLYRTILFQILSKCPDLIRTVFPETWDLLLEAALEMYQAETVADRKLTKREDYKLTQHARRRTALCIDKLVALAGLRWPSSDLLNRTSKLFSAAASDDKGGPCMFVLIDGLDELVGSEEDFEELSAQIMAWSRLPGVKICVTSRPWTIFETTFGGAQSFRLQDLTSGDVAMYVSDSFGESPLVRVLQAANPRRVPDLHQSIVTKAEGVFLWVRLVVRSLLAGLRNGDELSVLQQRVDELPADLERLYKHMMERIPQRYWSTSSRLFTVVRLMTEAGSTPE